jgi:hypothetical protein
MSSDNPFGNAPANNAAPNPYGQEPGSQPAQGSAAEGFDFDKYLNGAEKASLLAPKLNPGFAYRLRIDKVVGTKLYEKGPTVQIFCTVQGTNDGDGRVAMGKEVYLDISGFASDKDFIRAFAQQDLKKFMLAALAKHGIQEGHLATDPQIKKIAAQMCAQNLAEGAIIDVYTSKVGRNLQRQKLKYDFVVPPKPAA